MPTDPPLPERFTAIIDGMCRVIAAHIARDRSAGPFILLLCAKLRRMALRFAHLAGRAQAGPLPPPKPAKPRTRTAHPPSPLPRHYAWLIQRIQETAVYGSILRHMLTTDPELAALLAAAPQVGRILRPLCHMLAVRPAEVPILALPPRPRPVRDTQPKPPEPPPTAPGIRSDRIPEDRWVLPGGRILRPA